MRTSLIVGTCGLLLAVSAMMMPSAAVTGTAPSTGPDVVAISRIKAGDINCRGCNLAGANMGHAKLTAADFTGATIDIVNLKGADLSTASGLTQAQLDTACSDATTRLPGGLKAKPCS